MQHWWIAVWLPLLFLLLFLPDRRRRQWITLHLQKKRKGGRRKMPTELLQEFLGKMCTVMMFNSTFAVNGRIVAVEGNWLKVEEKNTVRLINGDMVQDIALMPEKYQK